MKKLLTINIIGIIILFLNGCFIANQFSPGPSFVSLFPIRGSERNSLEKTIIELFDKKILNDDLVQLKEIVKKSNKVSTKLNIDSLYATAKKRHYFLDYLDRKNFATHLINKKIFYSFSLWNCNSLNGNCDLALDNITLWDGRSYYDGMTRQEQQAAIKAFKDEILPLIKENVKRLKQEQ